MNGTDDEMLARDLRDRLRASETPDAVVRVRLSAARTRATSAHGSRPALAWGAAAMALAASVVAVVVVLGFEADREYPDARDEVAQGEIFELLLDDDDPILEAELYDDLDVLTWLAGEDERA